MNAHRERFLRLFHKHLQEQKVIRRVRTPEGARRYGQPIGSIIVRDVVPDAMATGQRRPSLDERVSEQFERNKEGAKRWPKDFQDPIQRYDGVYGLDWQQEDAEGMDVDSWRDRKTLANDHSAFIGIKVDEGVHPDIHETINAVMQSYEDMYPGFHNYFTKFTNDGQYQTPIFGGTVVAYNQWNPMTRLSSIHMNPGLFGTEDAVDRLTENVRASTKRGWWSVDFESLEDEKNEIGIEPWRLAVMNGMHHELGHTVGHVAVYSNDPNNNLGATEQIVEVLEKYGIVEDASQHRQPTDMFDVRNFVQYDSQAVTRTLSEYANSSLHETLAEAWADYMMSPEPKAISIELGEIMESYLLEDIEVTGKDKLEGAVADRYGGLFE